MTKRAEAGNETDPSAASLAAMWRDALIFDTGDTFSDMARLPPDRVANTNATAQFIVDYFNREGLQAQTLGERDLGLGRAAIEALKVRAKYSFITTNIVDMTSGKPWFSQYEIYPVGAGDKATKVAVFGLLGERGGAGLEADKLQLVAAIDALRPALVAAKAAGATIFIVLSQLTTREEIAVSEALPEVQIFLGGDSMSTSSDPDGVGAAMSAAGGQKGKHIGYLKLAFGDPRGFSAPFVDPKRRQSLEERRTTAQRKVDNYEKLIADRANQPPTTTPPAPAPPVTKRTTVPIEVYERQLASARAELQLVTNELETLGADAPNAAHNQLSLELIPLNRDIIDDPPLKAEIEAFRMKWPDPTPGH